MKQSNKNRRGKDKSKITVEAFLILISVTDRTSGCGHRRVQSPCPHSSQEGGPQAIQSGCLIEFRGPGTKLIFTFTNLYLKYSIFFNSKYKQQTMVILAVLVIFFTNRNHRYFHIIIHLEFKITLLCLSPDLVI